MQNQLSVLLQNKLSVLLQSKLSVLLQNQFYSVHQIREILIHLRFLGRAILEKLSWQSEWIGQWIIDSTYMFAYIYLF